MVNLCSQIQHGLPEVFLEFCFAFSSFLEILEAFPLCGDKGNLVHSVVAAKLGEEVEIPQQRPGESVSAHIVKVQHPSDQHTLLISWIGW